MRVPVDLSTSTSPRTRSDVSAARPPSTLAIVILTFNEEENLPRCLQSLAGLDASLLVVDSGSTDATREVADRHGARVLVHPFEGHAPQWQWALGEVPSGVEWVLGLDADQRLTPELRDEIGMLLRGDPKAIAPYNGFYLCRRQVFRGRWIRYGGYYPKYLLKLFRLSKVRVDERDLIDHHFYVDGRTANLRHDMIEDNEKENRISFWASKHIRYAELQAREEIQRRRGSWQWQVRPSLFGSPDERTAWLKQRWFSLPLYVRPFAYFLYRYVILRGFLDGKEGLIFHFLQALWYRLLVDVNIDELLRGDRVAAEP